MAVSSLVDNVSAGLPEDASVIYFVFDEEEFEKSRSVIKRILDISGKKLKIKTIKPPIFES